MAPPLAILARSSCSTASRAYGRCAVEAQRLSPVRSAVTGGVCGVRRRRLLCRASGEQNNSGERASQETIDRLERLLGIESEGDKEAEVLPPRDAGKEEKKEPVVPVVVKSEPQKRPPTNGKDTDWILAEFETDGKADIPNRALSSVSYLLPLLDGLHYARFIFMQVPQLTLLLLPLVPAIELFESARWLQIVAFFALALGVATNRNMPTFTRFNAQQAILLDILQIVPDLLLGNRGPAPGNDFLMQATIIGSNTVFIYVYLCCVGGAIASLNGKAIRLPLLGGAAESQSQR